MRPRTLRELTELARDEMTPTEEERGRVYNSLCVAVAAGAAGTALTASVTASAAASSAAASTAAASTAAASTTAASGTGSAAQGALATGAAAPAGGALAVSSSGLLLKGLVLIIAVGGGAGLLSAGGAGVAEHAHGAHMEDVVPLRQATEDRIGAPTESALIEPVSELGAQHFEAPARLAAPTRVQDRSAREHSAVPESHASRGTDESEAPIPNDEGDEALGMDTTLTRAARRLQHAQRSMARGDGAATLALLADEVDPRLRAERLALRVLALCQVGDVSGARREAEELRALDGPASAALALVTNSCAGP